MQNVIKFLFFFTLFYSITTGKVKYSLINEEETHSKNCADIELVNITVRQDKLATEKMSKFSMMLHDEKDNQYRANCTVLPQYEEDEKIPDIDTDEAGSTTQKENSDIKETEGDFDDTEEDNKDVDHDEIKGTHENPDTRRCQV